MSENLRAVKAQINDAQAIHDLINLYAQRGDMLPRTIGEVYENLRDFFVVRAELEPVAALSSDAIEAPRPGEDGTGQGNFLGCAALHIVWSDMAELKSLAVPEDVQSRGVGSLLVRAAVEEARSIGLLRAGRRYDAAAQGLERVLSLPKVPQLQRDRPDPRPG
jgi:amino-acid N-acetyltransferase